MLSESVIRKQLTACCQEKTDIFVKEMLTSTNTFLKERPLEMERIAVCTVNKQTETRGRFHRQYFAKENQGIYFSFSFYLSTEMGIPNVTIIAAVAVLQVFQEILPEKDFALKWVNDIYLDGKKVCGILAESTWETDIQRLKVVVGVGINHSIQTKEFPEEIRQRAVSLFNSEEEQVDRSVIIGKVVHRFFELLEQNSLAYLDIYRQYSLVLGRKVSFEHEGILYQGVAKEILADGALLVVLENGEERALHSGEISLKSYG